MSHPPLPPLSSPGSPPLTVLATRVAELHAALADAERRAHAGDLEGDARALLKAEIIALFRQADAAVQEAQAIKAEVKRLAAAWKSIGGETPIAPAPVASARVDHLGASTFIEKGWSKLSLGDLAGAEQALRKALELAAGSDEAETLLGWALMLQERYDEALVALQSVLARTPHYALARANLGYLCLVQGHVEDAIGHLGEAAQQDRDRKAALYAHLYLGIAYRSRERFDEAEQYFTRALALGPNLLQAWYELGWSHWQAGRQADALAAWRAGAESNKFNPWGKRCAEVIAMVEQGHVPPRTSGGGIARSS